MNEAIDTAYQMGVTDGATGSKTKDVDVTYTVAHTHGDYCYPIASKTERAWRDDPHYLGGGDWSEHGIIAQVTCNVCGAYWRGDVADDYRYDVAYQYPRNAYANHLRLGRCPNKGYQCGKTAGEYTTTDVTTLGTGDSVLSATIKY